MSLTLTLSTSFPHFRSSRFSNTCSASLIPRATAITAASVGSPTQTQTPWSFEETRGRIAKVFDKNNKNSNEVSISSYDTAWVAMVPSPFSSSEPCFPDCVFWLLENQCDDGSWARPHHHSHSLLKKDVLSSTLAGILALHKWGVGQENIQRGLQFIEQNISWASDESQITPIGFNIVFPALLDYARDSSLNLRLDPSMLIHLMHKRDLELQRCNESGDHESTEAYLAYIAEGLIHGKSHNWESWVSKYQRKNGSLFNSPSTTAAAYIALGNFARLNYLNLAFTNFGNAALPAVYPLDIYYHLSIVDNLQSLGISRYFSSEIRTVLNRTYRCWVQGEEEIFKDALTCALAFRILRKDGYDVTSDPITKIVSEGLSSSFPGNAWDINTTLELYKATEVKLYPHETDLAKQNKMLKSLLEQALASGSIQSCQLNAQVKQALDRPFHSILERMATRKNIENYNFDNTRVLKTSYCWPNFSSKDLVSLAVEDYNRCQVIHAEEMREIDRWFVDNRLDEVDYASQKYTYCYFTAAANIFAPEVSDARVALAKYALLVTVIDDLFDETGSMEEVTDFIRLVELWDVDVSKECSSPKVKIIFSALKKLINETAEKGFKLQGRSIKEHIVAVWLDVLHAFLKETEWSVSKYIPTFDEYMSNAWVSVGFVAIVLPALYLVGPKISEEMINHSEFHNLLKPSCISGRLLNDIQGVERELEEGKQSALPLYMRDNKGISKEAAIVEFQTMIDARRGELLRLFWEDNTVLPKPCKEIIWHVSAVCHVLYLRDDGFRSLELIQDANLFLHHPIRLGRQIDQM